MGVLPETLASRKTLVIIIFIEKETNFCFTWSRGRNGHFAGLLMDSKPREHLHFKEWERAKKKKNSWKSLRKEVSHCVHFLFLCVSRHKIECIILYLPLQTDTGPSHPSRGRRRQKWRDSSLCPASAQELHKWTGKHYSRLVQIWNAEPSNILAGSRHQAVINSHFHSRTVCHHKLCCDTVSFNR